VLELQAGTTIHSFIGFLGGIGVCKHLLAKQVLCFNHTSSPFSSGYFGDGGLVNYLPKLALNLDPPDLSLQSS
jgi:hypothetical protein